MSCFNLKNIVVNDLDQILANGNVEPIVGFVDLKANLVDESECEYVKVNKEVPAVDPLANVSTVIVGDNKSSFSIMEIGKNKGIIGTSFSAYRENYSVELGIKYAVENTVCKLNDMQYIKLLNINELRIPKSRPKDLNTLLLTNIDKIAVFFSQKYKKFVVYMSLINGHVVIKDFDFLEDVDTNSWSSCLI